MPPCKKEKLDQYKCVVPNCDNGKHNNYTLFKIPRHPDRRKTWLEIIGNPTLMECSATCLDKAGVCKNHFYAESFMNLEKKKLRPYANPVNLGVKQFVQLHASTFNFFDKPKNKEYSESIQNISNKDCSNNTNKHGTSDVEIMDLTNLPPWPAASPVKMVNVNDESYVSNLLKNDQIKDDFLYFKLDEGVITNILCDSDKDVINRFNRSVNETNLNFQSHDFQNNCALEHNLTQVFEKPQTNNIQKSVIGDTISNKKLKEIISDLEEENMMLKKKLRKFEQINKERNELLQKCNALQKKTAKQEKIIISLCKEINFLRK